MQVYGDLKPPERLLLGAGPSNIDPRVLKALTLPIVEHLDPFFAGVMSETVDLLRYAFKTGNKVTFPISGTGSAGMESAICNIVEEGDEVVVCISGFFGDRISDMVQRYGGKSIEVRAQPGKIIEKEAVEEALANSNAKAVAIVHAETSTGILQPLKEISKITHEYGALLVVDAVTSLGGCELKVDEWGIDICFSASQKCLGCPPGLAPITVSERAMSVIRNRRTRVRSWYFDLSTIEKYWIESNRVYHHTAPILLVYALREGLRLLYEERLENRWMRHIENMRLLVGRIEEIGLKIFTDKNHICPAITAINIPKNVNDENVRRTLREEYNITISGGLGELKGKIWRVGLMGVNSSRKNAILVAEALKNALKKEKYYE
ncbi:MAG: alanine--glyoxylate aminotransferase family protein [Candidatus Bathyarchaeota archaeon]|nr:alanine--glyoxylate aminotransferase family protein [Candidatus Bathyarchaeota archaeon]